MSHAAQLWVTGHRALKGRAQATEGWSGGMLIRNRRQSGEEWDPCGQRAGSVPNSRAWSGRTGAVTARSPGVRPRVDPEAGRDLGSIIPREGRCWGCCAALPACVSLLPNLRRQKEKLRPPRGRRRGSASARCRGQGKCVPWTGTRPPRRVRREGHAGKEGAAGVLETRDAAFSGPRTPSKPWAGHELPITDESASGQRPPRLTAEEPGVGQGGGLCKQELHAA